MTPLRARPRAIAYYLPAAEIAEALHDIAGDALEWSRWAIVLVYDDGDGEGACLRPIVSVS